MEKPKKCHFEIHNYEWYRDIKNRIWVVVGFWYENKTKDQVYLLQMGKTQYKVLPYAKVLEEIEKNNMKIITN